MYCKITQANSYKTMYICVVCSLNRPPLLPLTIELRQLLETLVSPITTTDINTSYLLLCSDCQIQMQSVHQFQKMALNGLRNLRQLLNIETGNGGYSNPEMSIHLKEEPLKTEPELDPETQPVCHLPQPDCKSEVKEPEPAFEPQYEVNCEFACFEPNIELTIGGPESPSPLKFKPINKPHPERAANKAKSTKVARKAKLATTASKKAKDAVDATTKDVNIENAVAPPKNSSKMSKKRKYSKDAIEKAINYVVNNQGSIRSASKLFDVPRASIQFKIKNPHTKFKSGPNTILTDKEETALADYVINYAKLGCPLNQDNVLSCVADFLKANPRRNPFKNDRPGSTWFRGFIRRHPDVAERISEGVTNASACVSERDMK